MPVSPSAKLRVNKIGSYPQLTKKHIYSTIKIVRPKLLLAVGPAEGVTPPFLIF